MKLAENVFIHPSSIVEEGALIGADTKIWHFSHVMDCNIGASCNIGQNVFVASGVSIGNHVKIQNNVSLYTGVICEDDVFIGPSVVFTNVINPRSRVERRDEFQQTLIGKGATIGANATIVCGNEIRTYAMIGAGAVITKSVKAFALVVGNPAVQIGWVSEFGNRLEFDESGLAICTSTNDKYQLKNSEVTRLK